uniref:DNA topoisomerase n=1 Tax=Agathobacter sp. TaxID=2021311 RepID=UPI004056AC1F
MGKSLIITEKPSVAQEFAKVLHVSGRKDGYIENGEYVITWCVGHLVGLVYPESYDERYKKWRLEDLPFLPETYKYDVIENVKKQYDIVHGMLMRRDIDRVYWAGDAGKEGQTIEENIRNFGGVRAGMEELRVWIDSQTEEEILRGIREAKPMSAYANLGNSGIMRTIEDYAMGINFSRVMSVKYGNLLNDAAGTKSYTAIAVGRVMTCVLGMVVNREREIRNFKETPFYRVIGTFGKIGIAEEYSIYAEWKATEGSKYFKSPLLYKENGFKEEKDAQALIDFCNGKEAKVKALEKFITKKKAPLLFNLVELQAECAKRFKISPDETLQAAQELYEKKLTTYPRTDARVLSTAVAKEITKNISRLKGYEPMECYAEHILEKKSYASIAKTQYVDDGKVTDHYAIIPTGQLSELKSLNSLQKHVFELICRRFLSIFYPPAEYENVKLTVGVESERFFASAKALKKPGYLEVAGIPQKSNGAEERTSENGESDAQDPHILLHLADKLSVGETISPEGYAIRHGKTSPPKRYTSGSMVLAMENAGQLIEEEELREQIKGSGIGTSATRAEIIKKLIRIGYLKLNQKTQVLTPENLGEMIFEVVNLTVPALLNPKMTASWEKGLDGITKGTVDFWEYRRKLEDYIRKETLKMAEQDICMVLAERISAFAGKNARGNAVRRKIGVKCPICQGNMVTAPFGFGCSNYKADKSGCNFTIGEIAGITLTEEQVKDLLENGHTEAIRGFKSKSKKKFDARLKLNKTEGGKLSVEFDFADIEPEILPDVICPSCGGQMVKKSFGYGCVNYNQADENSCRFALGTIAGKTLSASAVKQLLAEKKTNTIRGFKSKTGKKFDACLILENDETGKPVVKFDFEHVEAKKIKDAACPLCQGSIIVTPFGYGCSNYSKENPDSCHFIIGKIASVKLKEEQVKELLTTGKTGMIQGFVAKTGMKFDAPLKLTEDGKITFDFPKKPKPEESSIECPKCHKKMLKGQWQYECKCGFKLWHTVAKVPLSEEIIMELLVNGRTKEKVAGFTSKAGNLFDAYLKYEEDVIKFEFERKTDNLPLQMPGALSEDRDLNASKEEVNEKTE